MKVLELYAGTRSIGKAFERKGHEVYSVEWDKKHPNIDWYVDIATITAEDILERFGKPDVIWDSRDCTSYSIAGIAHHRKKDANGNLAPVSAYAKQCDFTNQHVMDNIIKPLDPSCWFIENPRGGMRKMWFMQDLTRYTITYCQYGDTRMKPTDIWSNLTDLEFKPMCKNGDPCHDAAPRGTRAGTQGLEKVNRSRIPDLFCDEIVRISENELRRKGLM